MITAKQASKLADAYKDLHETVDTIGVAIETHAKLGYSNVGVRVPYSLANKTLEVLEQRKYKAYKNPSFNTEDTIFIEIEW